MIVLTNITTSSDGVQHTPVDSLHSGFQVAFNNPVELESLPGRDLECPITVFIGYSIHV
jgi:hypothetical protein